MSSPLPRTSPDRDLFVCHMGSVPYARAVEIQRRIREQRIAGELPDTLLLLEHPRVYTRGRRSAAGELPLARDLLPRQGIESSTTDRGGRITYHGPGQLVGYPIMRDRRRRPLPAHDGAGDRRGARASRALQRARAPR